jgi:hypothetical protein
MNLIQTAILTFLPPKRKMTPSGWTSFDAPCCVHNGQNADTRKRGGILVNGDGFQYHCFNCNFKAGWQPGKLLSKNTKNLFGWLGMPQSDIQKLGLHALQSKEDRPKTIKELSFHLDEIAMPDMTMSLTEWANSDLTEDVKQKLLAIFDYINSRGMGYDWYQWHWSYTPGYRDRVILPFFHEGKIVGWTGRKITEGKPKYLTHSQPGYVFNVDAQTHNKKFVVVVEGQFDAIAIEGVAIMTNEPNETQCARINALGKEVIVVPDRDAAGSKLIGAAVEHGWGVSLPEWGPDVKDVADAVKKFGRIYTLFTILHYRETNEIKKQLLKKKLENVEL